MKATSLLALLVSSVMMFLPGPAWARDVAFEAQGEVSKIIHHGTMDPDDLVPFHYRFSVAVAGERYFIRLVPALDQTEPEERYIEVGFDGEQQYVYRRSGRRSGTTSDGVDHIVDLAYVTTAVVPTALSDATIPPLWFAFASGSAHQNGPLKHILPLWLVPVPNSLLGQVKFPIQCDLYQDPLSLPERAHFRSEGVSYAFDHTVGLLKSRWPPPYDLGYVIAEYAVQETRRVRNGLLPTRAVYRQYGLVPSNRQMIHQLLYELNIRVTNVLEEAVRDSFVPRIITKTTIIDGRRSGNPVEADYVATNWPSSSDPSLLYAFRKADEADRNLKAFLGPGRPWRLNRLIFFLAVAATALVVVLLRLRRNHNLQ